MLDGGGSCGALIAALGGPALRSGSPAGPPMGSSHTMPHHAYSASYPSALILARPHVGRSRAGRRVAGADYSRQRHMLTLVGRSVLGWEPALVGLVLTGGGPLALAPWLVASIVAKRGQPLARPLAWLTPAWLLGAIGAGAGTLLWTASR